jgi:hypothetical protein
MGAAVICELEVSQLGYVRMRMGPVSSIGHSVHTVVIGLGGQLDRGHILWCGRVVRVERAHRIRIVRGVQKMLDVGRHGMIEFGHIRFVARDHVVIYVFREDEFVGYSVAHHSARDTVERWYFATPRRQPRTTRAIFILLKSNSVGIDGHRWPVPQPVAAPPSAASNSPYAKNGYTTTDDPRLLFDPDTASIRRLTLTSIS